MQSQIEAGRQRYQETRMLTASGLKSADRVPALQREFTNFVEAQLRPVLDALTLRACFVRSVNLLRQFDGTFPEDEEELIGAFCISGYGMQPVAITVCKFLRQRGVSAFALRECAVNEVMFERDNVSGGFDVVSWTVDPEASTRRQFVSMDRGFILSLSDFVIDTAANARIEAELLVIARK